MKKSLFVLTAALMFGGLAGAQTTSTASAPQVPALTDVPAGHWAKDAIDRLVSRGIILGYPDGTYRGTQNLTRYEAAVIIARLLDQIRSGNGPALGSEDLMALQNAVQELAADLAALGVRVSDLEENSVSKDDFARLEARVEEVAGANGDATAIGNIQSQIDELSARADQYDTLRADVDDNASSIAALNDLTVLLNQDILDLQDRVSAVEAAQADFVQRSDFDNLSTKVTGIDTRVTTLENAPKFSVNGTLTATYGKIGLTQGATDFDVDRLTRQTFADNVFSDGRIHCNDGSYNQLGNPVACVDTNRDYTGNDSGFNFGVKASNLTTANGKIVVNNAAANLYTNNFFSGTNDVTVNLDNVTADGTINGQKFDVRYEHQNSSFKFNDYLFANDNYLANGDTGNVHRGVVANIQADNLPLKPKVTVVAGAATPTIDTNNTLAGSYYGIRASVNPGSIGTFGVSFAQMNGGTFATGTAVGRSAASVDYDLGFGVKNSDGVAPFAIKGAYVGSVPNSADSFVAGSGTFQKAFDNLQNAFYTDGKADLGVVKVGANFRAINPAYADGVASMSTNYAGYYPGSVLNSYPYAANQVGFGGAVGTNLGPVALSAYGDSHTAWVKDTPRYTSFGVGGGLKYAGLKLTGFYNRSTLDQNGKTTTLHADVYDYAGPTTYGYGNGGFAYNLSDVYMDIADVPFSYSSTTGAKLSHDGSAADALVKNLNFTVADAYFYDDRINDFQVYGDYKGTLAGITVAPFARYHLFTTPDDATVSQDGVSARTYNVVKYGVKVSTQPFTSVPLQPSLFANFAQRISNAGRSFSTQANTGTTTNTSAETFVQVGGTFNQFLVPDMKASLGYAYYNGKNVGTTATGTTLASSASGLSATYSPLADRFYRSPLSGGGDPYTGGNFGAGNGKLDGVFGQLDWNGLQANYGVFRYNDYVANTQSIAQAFKVGYTFKF